MSDEAIAAHFDRLRGRILGLIESWGLPQAQERGCKSIFKSLTYDMEKDIKDLFTDLTNELAAAQRPEEYVEWHGHIVPMPPE